MGVSKVSSNSLCIHLPPPPAGTPPSRRRRFKILPTFLSAPVSLLLTFDTLSFIFREIQSGILRTAELSLSFFIVPISYTDVMVQEGAVL